MNRRDFITGAAALAAMPSFAEGRKIPENFKWAMLVHFGMNWLGDLPRPRKGGGKPTGGISGNLTQEEYDQICDPLYWEIDHIRFDEQLWREYAERLQKNGCNEIVIDLCEFMKFRSHPELAVKGTWEPERMVEEVARLKGMGFSVIPKLNFSCTHNGWMGDYKRMVSSKPYYRFCSEVIKDVMDVFKGAECFHLGFDEEDEKYQNKDCSVKVVRSPETLWHDIRFLADEVRKYGCRPWMWADRIRKHSDEFCANVPKDVICSEWMYYADYGKWNPQKQKEVEMCKGNDNQLARFEASSFRLSQSGLTMMPGGSHCYGSAQGCFDQMRWALNTLPTERLRGFVMTTWMPVLPAYRRLLFEGADIIGRVRAAI